MAKRKPPLNLQPGDCVLIGSSRATMPTDWFAAKVLWADRDHVLIQHEASGERHRQVLSVELVRAVGEYALLAEFKERARKAVMDAQAVVRETETALGQAREAVWVKLDEINASDPQRLERAP